MGSLSALTSAHDHHIYIPFCAKHADGVNSTTFIDCYTTSTNSWRRRTSIPSFGQNLILKDFAMVPLAHHIYVIGGRLCRRPTESNTAGTRHPSVVACVLRYNVQTDVWDTCAPMANPRFNFACTISHSKIYVAGGQNTLGSARGISSTEVYDPAMDQWRPLADMSTMRYKCVGVTYQGKIHVVGGFVDDGENSGPYGMKRSSAEVYDIERNRWDFIARMWALDVPPYQIAPVNGKLFSSGDCYMPWKGHIEAYDEKENIWNVVHGSRCDCLSPTASPEKAPQRVYLTMAAIENKLYFLAGYRMPGEVSRMRSEVRVFDTAANGDGWESFEATEEEGEKELCGHCCIIRC